MYGRFGHGQRQETPVGDTRLVMAIKRNDVKELTSLGGIRTEAIFHLFKDTKTNPDVMKTVFLPHENLTLMHVAAFYNSLDCMLYLMEKGMKLDAQSAASYLPLHYACLNNSQETAMYIMELCPKCVSIAPTDNVRTYTYLAAQAGNALLMRKLLSLNAVVETKGAYKAISRAIEYKNAECLKLILDYSKDKNSPQRDYSPLMEAIQKDSEEAVTLLLEAGEDPQFVSRDNRMALFLACEKGWTETVKKICAAGSAMDIQANLKCAAAIHYACGSGNAEIINQVIGLGVDVNREDQNGHTFMHNLIDGGKLTTAEIIGILENMKLHGLIINGTVGGDAISSMSKTPEVIMWLFENGLSPSERYKGQDTMLELLKKKSRTKLALRKVVKFVEDSLV